MQILNGRRHRVASLAFSHCGRWLAAGGRGGLHLWDTTKPGERARPVTIVNPQRHVLNLAFRPDGRLFCTSWDAWYLVDPERPAPVRISNQRFDTFAFSPDATRAVRTYQTGPLRTYRIGGEKVTAGPVLSGERTYFGGAAFSADGSAFAVEEEGLPSRPAGRRVALRDADSGKRTALCTKAFDGRSRLLFSPDGSTLVAVCSGSLARWSVAEPGKTPRKAVNPSRKHFLSAAFHPGGQFLTVDNDRLVRVWDTGSLAAERAIEWNVGKLYAVAVSPDGTRVAVGSHTGKVLVWDWD